MRPKLARTLSDGDVRAEQPADCGDDEADREFRALLDRRDVHMVFQSLVDLRSGEVVALEALARGPESTRFASPDALFAAARRVGRVAELDWVCRAAAFRAFLEAGIPPAMSLFVNVEPEAIATECPADLSRFVTRAETSLRVFVEINDRALASDPAGVLAAVDRARERGWGIAIDDIGASRAPISMLSIVVADLVKLDLRRLAEASAVDSYAIITSVLRHIEQTGATLLVEGIENEEDARWARALGALYGQGYHLGKPGPLNDQYRAPFAPVRLIKATAADRDIATPFALLAHHECQKMSERHFEKLARVLAYSPRSIGTWPVFLVGVARDDQLPAELLEQGFPAETLLFVMFGTRLGPQPMPGLRGVRLRPDDPLADERFLIFLSDEGLVAIFARPCPGDLYEVVVSQDRDLVLSIVRHLMRRVPQQGRSNIAMPARARGSAVVCQDVVSQSPTFWRGWRARLGGR